MKLFEFFHIYKISKKNFAAKLNISYPTFLSIYHGKRHPRIDMVQKIAELTDGKVSFDDFVNIKDFQQKVK